jgi:hypothetical protein
MPTSPLLDAPLPQHLQALELANHTRLAHAAYRHELHELDPRAGRERVAELLDSGEIPDDLRTLPIAKLLTYIQRCGSTAARRLLGQAGWHVPISEGTTLGALTERQRHALANALQDRP